MHRAWLIQFRGSLVRISLHGVVDHCIGIPVLLRDMLSRDRTNKVGKLVCDFSSRTLTVCQFHQDPIEVFGPLGLRRLIRTVFKLTSSTILKEDKYCVHELITPDEMPTPCDTDVLHHNELPGRDLRPDDRGLWRNMCITDTFFVSAASIVHRGMC